MKAPWSPDKDAKGADPNNPPKGNPPPDYNKPYKYEYTWAQMGGTNVVECEILEAHVDTTYTIKFWDYNVNDWEIRRVQRDDVRAIYEPAPLGKIKPLHQAWKDASECLWCGLRMALWKPREECRGHNTDDPRPNPTAVVYHPEDCPHNLAFDMTKILIVPEGAKTLKCANCTTVLGYIERIEESSD